ncbi:Uma2 family endonuclease [Anthocerotibacter panamensis]|uniref:Uma2 family endonuclease n=1 Tax=Anthocerotibacter panamensis TaxID=2857077 RepID=UPI001C407298|nr:Uma2 family endonuclease [Anthocerotibacter panamensis]
MSAITIDFSPVLQMTDEQFWELCQRNRDVKFERNAQGALIIMAPTGGETGNTNIELEYQLQGWSREHRGQGLAFNSSTGFKLPNGADRSPDAAWIRRERWQALTATQRKKFPPLCPDFVVELKSPTDDLAVLRAKMQEYIEHGAKLGWLLDPETRQVVIYRPDRAVETLEGATILSGEDVLPGFVLDLKAVWEAANDD